MRINWKLRAQNKVTLLAIISGVIAVVYTVLGWFGITPSIPDTGVKEVAETIVGILVLLGIVVDPTTEGISDSVRAMGYDEPSDDYEYNQDPEDDEELPA